MSVLKFIGDRHLNYKIPIIDDGYREEVEEEIVNWLDRCPIKWDLMDLVHIPWDLKTISSFQSKLGRNSYKPIILEDEKSPYLILTNNNDIFSNLSDQSFQRYLKRKLKKFEKDFTCRFITVKNDQELERYFPVFVQLHKIRAQEKLQIGTFRDKNRERFFYSLLHHLLKLKLLHLHFILLNDQPIAGLMNFQWKQKMHFFQSGFNLIYSKYSVGHIIHYYAIQYAMQNGCREYDFLIGYEPYKIQWTSRFRQLYRIQIIKSKMKNILFEMFEGVKKCIINIKFLKRIYFFIHSRFLRY